MVEFDFRNFFSSVTISDSFQLISIVLFWIRYSISNFYLEFGILNFLASFLTHNSGIFNFSDPQIKKNCIHLFLATIFIQKHFRQCFEMILFNFTFWNVILLVFRNAIQHFFYRFNLKSNNEKENLYFLLYNWVCSCKIDCS